MTYAYNNLGVGVPPYSRNPYYAQNVVHLKQMMLQALVSHAWSRLVADRENVGRPIAANDAWIAACCLAADLPIMTLNLRHFEAIPGLALLP